MGSRILRKWLHGFIHKPFTILKSIYYNITNKNQDLASQRLAVCNSCECKEYYKGTYVCNLCGCILDNKTRIDEEICEMNKW